RCVDHGIPFAGLQRRQSGLLERIAVTDAGVDTCAPRYARTSPREDRDVVPARERCVDEVTSEEPGSPQNEDLHSARIRSMSSACSCGSPHASTSPPSSHGAPRQSVTTPPADWISGTSDWMSYAWRPVSITMSTSPMA